MKDKEWRKLLFKRRKLKQEDSLRTRSEEGINDQMEGKGRKCEKRSIDSKPDMSCEVPCGYIITKNTDRYRMIKRKRMKKSNEKTFMLPKTDSKAFNYKLQPTPVIHEERCLGPQVLTNYIWLQVELNLVARLTLVKKDGESEFYECCCCWLVVCWEEDLLSVVVIKEGDLIERVVSKESLVIKCMTSFEVSTNIANLPVPLLLLLCQLRCAAKFVPVDGVYSARVIKYMKMTVSSVQIDHEDMEMNTAELFILLEELLSTPPAADSGENFIAEEEKNEILERRMDQEADKEGQSMKFTNEAFDDPSRR